MVALDPSGHSIGSDDWEWEPSKTLTHIVERGLEYPRRAFSAYLTAQDTSLVGAILAFDVSNQVIFGLSMDDEGEKPENLERAKKLLHEMAERLAATHGFIGVEQEPPLRGKKEPHATIWCIRGKLLVNAVTAEVGTMRNLSGFPTSQGLRIFSCKFCYKINDQRCLQTVAQGI